MNRRWLLLIPALIIAGCSSSTDTQKKSADAERAAAPPAEKAPEPTPVPTPAPAPPAVAEKAGKTFKVKFETSKGPILVEVHKDWAPLGAARFEELVKAKFFDEARFFRVVPNFVIQFGLAASPAVTKKWDHAIKDDAVSQTNRRGALSFATMGSETRTSQVFINLRSNQSLDTQGFAPFAMVVDGMSVVDQIYSGYGDNPDQDLITRRGNAYLEAQFPKLDYIKTARIQ